MQSTTYLKNEFEKQLAAYSLPAEEIISGGTPRRLYVYIRGLSQRQEDKTEIVTGPPAKIAFTDSGELTPVGLKFAESKGLTSETAGQTECADEINNILKAYICRNIIGDKAFYPILNSRDETITKALEIIRN